MASETTIPRDTHEDAPRTGSALVSGVLAAFGASACCAGPLLLVTLGAGGVWAARLRALEPLQPLFLAAALLAVGWAFHRLYVAPRRCAPGQACAVPAVLRRQRIAFWIALAVIVALAGFPWLAPLLY
jgi:mercuric ion transport protein